jgi:hypothetical protein
MGAPIQGSIPASTRTGGGWAPAPAAKTRAATSVALTLDPKVQPGQHSDLVTMSENAREHDLVDGMPERLYTGSVWAEGPVWIPS